MKKKNIISIGLIALSCISCNNYLDIKPYGRTIPKTAEEFSALIHTRLNSIDAGSDSYLVGNANQWMTWDAVCGDDFETCLTSSGARSLATYVGDIIRTKWKKAIRKKLIIFEVQHMLYEVWHIINYYEYSAKYPALENSTLSLAYRL